MISQQVPWDPLTLFQRWILRARVAEEETSGLDLGDTRMHVTALQGKVDAVQQVNSLSKNDSGVPFPTLTSLCQSFDSNSFQRRKKSK